MFKKMVIAVIVVGSLVVGYTGFRDSPAQASHNCSSDSTVLAANPELAAACRYHNAISGSDSAVPGAIEAGLARPSDLTRSTSLVANPELLKAQRPIMAAGVSESTVLADNPELMLARRNNPAENEVDPDRDVGLLEFFTGPLAIQGNADEDIGLLDFSRPPAVEEVSASDQLSALLALNPELSVIYRYADLLKARNDAAFLAANPEIIAVRHYGDAIEHRSGPPVTYDVETLRDFFAHEWTTEADTIDPGPLMLPADKGSALPQSDFLAANPELSIVRRYTSMIENNGGSRAVTFDVEALRAFFAHEWTAEADTIDPSPLRYSGIEMTAISNEATVSMFQAANPALSIAQCSAILAEWNRRHHPGR